MKKKFLLFCLMLLAVFNISSQEKKNKFVKIFDKLYKVYFIQQKTSDAIKKEEKFVSLYKNEINNSILEIDKYLLNNDYKRLLNKFHPSYFQKLIIVYCKRRNQCFKNNDELIRQLEKEISELLENKEKRKYIIFSGIPDIIEFNYSKLIKERRMKYIIEEFSESSEGLYFNIILSDENLITDYFSEPMRANGGIFVQRSYVMTLLIQPNKQITIMDTYSIDLSSNDVSYPYLLTPEENQEAIKRKILGVE